MPITFKLGERVLIPTFAPPAEPKPGDPSTRPLWIYASDPASVGLRHPVLKIDVPYEEVKPGPEGNLFKVLPDALPADLVKLLDWGEDKVKKFATAAQSRRPVDAGARRVRRRRETHALPGR